MQLAKENASWLRQRVAPPRRRVFARQPHFVLHTARKRKYRYTAYHLASYENRVSKLEQADGGRGWNLRRLLLRISADEAGEPLAPELQGEPYGPLVEALTRIGGEHE
jgi:hypothetical protein